MSKSLYMTVAPGFWHLAICESSPDPTYFEKLPPLIDKINREKRNSKNYVLFLGSTDAERTSRRA